MEGSNRRACANGVWSGQRPVCFGLNQENDYARTIKYSQYVTRDHGENPVCGHHTTTIIPFMLPAEVPDTSRAAVVTDDWNRFPPNIRFSHVYTPLYISECFR